MLHKIKDIKICVSFCAQYSCPSKVMMTLFSVAPRLPWARRWLWSPILDLQVRGQCGHGKRPGLPGASAERLSSFPGLLHLCAAPLLECVHGVSGEGSPSSPVMSAGLKLLGGNFCLACAGLYTVFESLERPALLSLPRSELPKRLATRQQINPSWWSQPRHRGGDKMQPQTEGCQRPTVQLC